ncbi:MAG TPA: hypothetical protein PLA27_11860 [Anaerolineales bacterium]|jgi:hypothetical protein|nr:hypothetical protein [Anaerolineales bacterium]HQX17111.1 hypothetical protein [Anaerolineales bacterium]
MTRGLKILFFVSALVSSCASVEPAPVIPTAVNPVSTPIVAVTSVPRIKSNNLTFVEFFSGA